MMKKITVLKLTLIILFFQACQEKKSNTNQPTANTLKAEVVKKEPEVNPNKIVFENLDQILSPFEDMTEFALNKDEAGILESLEKVETATKDSVFVNNLTIEKLKSLSPKIEKLKGFIKQKNYEQIALASTDIFEFNISNFIDTKKIENQIHIEHLDYMGFKVLALLNQQKIDWKNIAQTISGAEKEWIALNPKVADNNLKDSFEYLIKGLRLCAKNKDAKMGKILASMDLSLVDVLENSI